MVVERVVLPFWSVVVVVVVELFAGGGTITGGRSGGVVVVVVVVLLPSELMVVLDELCASAKDAPRLVARTKTPTGTNLPIMDRVMGNLLSFK